MRIHKRTLGLLAAALLVSATGCMPGQKRQDGPAGGKAGAAAVNEELSTYARRQLQAELTEFGESFSRIVIGAATQIEGDAATREARQAAVAWKTKLPKRCQEHLSQEQPVEALLDLWSLCRRQLDFLTIGEGKSLFGEAQPLAVEAATELQSNVYRIAERRLVSADIEEIGRQIAADAAERPFVGLFDDPPEQESQRNWGQQLGGALPNLLMPRQIKEGAESLQRMEEVAGRAVDIFEDLPASARYQAELLLAKLEEFAAIKRAMDSFDRLTLTGERLAETADTLPQRLREEIGALLEQVDEQQPELQKTLAEARQTTESVRLTLAEARELTQEAERLAGAWTMTAEAAQDTVRAVAVLTGRDPNGGPTSQPADGAPSFDIRDYQAITRDLNSTTAEVRGLVSDLREMLAGGEVDQLLAKFDTRVDTGITRGTDEARATIDHLTIRLGQLCGVVFVLAVAFRLIFRSKPSKTERTS